MRPEPEQSMSRPTGSDRVVTLAVPATLGADGIARLRAELLDALCDPAICVVVLRGTPDAFCRGMDLSEITLEPATDPAPWIRATGDFTEVLLGLRQARTVTLAVIEGPAMGGGVGLAAACDFVLCSENASFALPELLLGLVPAMILPVLGERLGLHQAKRWAMTQAQWKANEAKSAGLVDLLVSAERLDVELSRLLRTLLRAHPRGTSELKRLVREIEGMDITRAIEMGRDALTVLLGKPEVRRDIIAFRDFGFLPGEADT